MSSQPRVESGTPTAPSTSPQAAAPGPATLETPETRGWALFLCYRQTDGADTAEIVYESLQSATLPYTPSGFTAPPQLTVYFDRTAAALPDWTLIHGPSLRKARSFIVVCSPGAYARFKDDWVHLEIDWWINNRACAPVIIDPVGDGRWIPPQIASRWPTAQRLTVIPAQWPTDPGKRSEANARLRDRIIAGIQADDLGVVDDLRRRLAEEQSIALSLKRQRRRLRLLVGLFLAASVAALIFAVITLNQRRDAQQLRARAVANSLLYATNLELEVTHNEELGALLAVQAASTDKGALLPAAQQVFRFLSRPMSHIMDDARPGPIALSAVTGHLAAACEDGAGVCIWDLRSPNTEPRRFATDERTLLGLAFSPQEDAIAACTDGGSLYVWDFRRGGQIAALRTTCPDHLRLAVPDDGSRVVVTGRDQFITVWDTSTRTSQSMEMSGAMTVGVAFEADKQSFTILDATGNHYLWTPSRGAQLVEHLDQHGLALSTSGERALVRDGTEVTACDREKGKYTRCGYPLRFSALVQTGSLSSRGRNFVIGSEEPTLTFSLADTNTNGQLPLFGEAASEVAISELAPDQDTPWLAASGRDVRVWAPTAYHPLIAQALGGLSQPPIQQGDFTVHNGVEAAAFSTATARFAVSRSDGNVEIYDLRQPTARPVTLIPQAPVTPVSDSHGSRLSPVWTELAWSGDGKRLAGYRADGQIAVWRPSRDSRPERLIKVPELLLRKALSPSLFAFKNDRDDRIHIEAWNGSEPARTLESLSSLRALSWSDDGRTLLAGNEHGSVEVWLNGNWEHPILLAGNSAPVNDIALSPSHDEIAAATTRGVVTWNLATTTAPSTRYSEKTASVSIRYSPDGTRLAGATGREVMTWEVGYTPHDPFVWIDNGVTNDPHTFVRFSPAGDLILTSGSYTNMVSFPEIMRSACQLLWRNLSMAEWRSHLGLATPYQCTCANLGPGQGTHLPRCPPSSSE